MHCPRATGLNPDELSSPALSTQVAAMSESIPRSTLALPRSHMYEVHVLCHAYQSPAARGLAACTELLISRDSSSGLEVPQLSS